MEKLTAAQYFEKKQEVTNRISSLESEISQDKKDLAAAETEYKRLVFAQEDAAADAVFTEKQTLSGQIKSKESRLQTIKDMKDEDLLSFSLKILEYGTHELAKEYKDQIDELTAATLKARSVYLDSLRALNG